MFDRSLFTQQLMFWRGLKLNYESEDKILKLEKDLTFKYLIGTFVKKVYPVRLKRIKTVIYLFHDVSKKTLKRKKHSLL